MAIQPINNPTLQFEDKQIQTKENKVQEASLPTLKLCTPLSKKSHLKRQLSSSSVNLPAAKVRKCLFDRKTYEVKDLKKLYNIDFEHLPVRINKTHFFQIRDQLLEIENYQLRNKLEIEMEWVRTGICKILQDADQSHQQKMAELGAILYFMERDHSLTKPETTFTEMRAEEILKEIKVLKKRHTKIQDTENNLPSGKTYYLLRTFARMLLTHEQKLNVGSLYFIQEVLKNAEWELAGHFRPEHRDHILIVLNNILSKPKLQALFEKPIQVHTDMANMIRLDLKLSKDDLVTSSHVKWACLITLFFDVRQTDNPNCFAITSLIYATQNSTFKLVSQLIDWLTTGHFAFSDTIAIPILPLVEKRLINELDLQIQLKTTDALSLATIEYITHVLGVDQEDKTFMFGGTQTLHTILKKLFESKNNEENLFFAKQLFYSFKHNSLAEALLAINEFLSSNKPDEDLEGNEFSYQKRTLIEDLISPIESICNDEFLTALKEKLGQRLWLENCTEMHRQIKDSTLTIGPSDSQYVVDNFSGDLEALVEVLDEAQHIFLLHKGKYALIRKISDLKNIVESIAQETAEEIDISISNAIKTTLDSKSYAKHIADLCAEQISNKGIEGRDLYKSDLLFFQQPGGNPTEALPSFQLSPKRVDLEASNVSKFLKRFVESLKDIGNKALSTIPLLLIETSEHCYTLNPKKCSYVLNAGKQFKHFILNQIETPVKKLLSQPIPDQTIKKIIDQVFIEADEKSKIQLYFDNLTNLSFNEFYKQIQDFASSQSENKRLKKIIDREYWKISLTPEQLHSIFKQINIHLGNSEILLIHGALEQKFQKNRAFPFQIATFLRKKLINMKQDVIDPYDLEVAICQTLGLPLILDMGDLNYADRFTENPVHSKLILRYHFGSQSLSFFVREKNHERLEESQDEYFEMSIYYPA